MGPTVRLVGEMSGTGFKDRQWLVERDGHFVQLTELLYRVLEQVNGQRTLEEIAEAITQSSEWMVAGSDVRQLIHLKLVPLGLIAPGGDSVRAPGSATGEHRASSPLTVNMRLRTLSPRAVDAITKVLQACYTTPVLVSVLIVAAIAHGWLYGAHGIAEAITAALYAPGGLLFVLAVVVVAGMFHEFGHAAALSYGGGTVRGMGVGLYLIYPVLYTDVTDSYRLGRWARVRTDLGGIYFHLIFAIALIGLYVVTGRELILFAVLLINLEMIHQLLPFVRLDGYWMLADLTGIPDLLSQTGPFLRSLRRGGKGSALPALKPWVKAVFVTYVVTTVPLLAYLFFLMIRNLPRLLTWIWSALLRQVEVWSTAQSQGDWLIMAMSGTQMLLLAVPGVATLYVILSVCRSAVRAAWDWSRPTATRRLVAGLVAAAVAMFVGLSWLPQLREGPRGDAFSAPADNIDGLLTRTREATAKLHTLQADLDGSLGPDHFTGSVVLKRPNLARVNIKGEGGLGDVLIVSDGRSLYTYFPGEDRYVRSVPGPEGRYVQAFVAEQVTSFFRPDVIGMTAAGGALSYVGSETADGTEYEVVVMETPAPRRKSTRYFISPKDSLVHRVVTTTERRDGTRSVGTASLRNIRRDAPIDGSTFRWTPLPTSRPLQLPIGIPLPTAEGPTHRQAGGKARPSRGHPHSRPRRRGPPPHTPSMLTTLR